MALRVVLNVPVAGRPLNVVGNVDIVFGLSWHFAGPTEEKADTTFESRGWHNRGKLLRTARQSNEVRTIGRGSVGQCESVTWCWLTCTAIRRCRVGYVAFGRYARPE